MRKDDTHKSRRVHKFQVNFDDNAEYRQQELFVQRDESQEDAREVAAKKCARPDARGNLAGEMEHFSYFKI